MRGDGDFEAAEAMRDVTAEKLDVRVEIRAGEAGMMFVVVVFEEEVVGVALEESVVGGGALII